MELADCLPRFPDWEGFKQRSNFKVRIKFPLNRASVVIGKYLYTDRGDFATQQDGAKGAVLKGTLLPSN